MLEGLEPIRKHEHCALERLLRSLDKQDQEILQAAINDIQTWSSWALSKALRDRGIVIADHTITKHRNKLCVCPRS